MQHWTLSGRHYEMGLQQETALREAGRTVLDEVPFPLTHRLREFARACMPAYERWFPAILEELRGLADGQGCAFADLSAVLLTMYCFVPEVHCSVFAVCRNGWTILGRNSDFLPALEALNANCLYQFSDGRGFLGNTTAFLEMEDGVNRWGFAAGLTSVAPVRPEPGLNAGMLLRLLLETCRNVEEALTLLRQVPTASSHTLVLADRQGGIALVESAGNHTEVRNPKDRFVCAVNAFHLPAMQPYGQPVEDTWFSEERYQTLIRALPNGVREIEDAMDLLAGKKGFLCQYDRGTGKDTVWSVVYDLTAGCTYRAEGNPARKPFRRDDRLSSMEH